MPQGPPVDCAPFSWLPPRIGHGLNLWRCRQLCGKPESLELVSRWRGEATDLAWSPTESSHVSQKLGILEGRHSGVDHRDAELLLQLFKESVLCSAAEDDHLRSIVGDRFMSRFGQSFAREVRILLKVVDPELDQIGRASCRERV